MAYSFQHDPEVSWEILTNMEQVEQAVRELADARWYAWDVETNSTSPFAKNSHVIGHAFAWRQASGKIRSVYMPMRHKSALALFQDVKQLDATQTIHAVKPILEGSTLKAGHNLNFDVHMAYQDGIKVAPAVHDTLVAARLINETRKPGRYKLHCVLEDDHILHQRGWKDYIKPDLLAQAKQFRMKLRELQTTHGYELIAVDRLGLYACQDAVYEYRLAEFQFPLVAQWSDIWQMEMRLFWVCIDMARVGVPIDPNVLHMLEHEQKSIMNELMPKIWMQAGEEFAITDNSLRRIFFDKFGIEPKGQTKSGVNRMDDDVLWSIEKSEPRIAEFAKLVRSYRAAEKVVTTYTHGITAHADEHNIVHSEIDQGGAKTGRVSSRRPNLQNQPARTALGRRVREAFITRPNMLRYCLDYCLVGDTEVITELGPLQIRDAIHINSKVLSCSSTGEFGFKEIERSAKIGKKIVNELVLDGDIEVLCTADHEWMRFDGVLVKTSDLRMGDRLRRVYQGDTGNYPSWWWRAKPEHCVQKCNFRGSSYEVTEVRLAEERMVYHLTIADWHTFVLANGLVSGNSQIELRVLAHLSQDEIMLNVYHNDLDIHSATAREVFGTDGIQDGIDMRHTSKILNFGIPFGVTELGIQRNINKGLPDGQEPFTEASAKKALDGFYEKYRSIDTYRRSLWKRTEQNDGEFWNMFGRPRRISGLDDSRHWIRSRARRQTISSMIQGTAADLVKYSMVAVWDYLRSQTECEAYMVMMIHDDLQFDMAYDGSAKVIREVRRLMEQTCQDRMSVPIRVDVEYFTDNWANKKKLEGF